MLKKTLKRIGLGFLLGAVIGNLVAVLTGGGELVSPLLTERTGSLQTAILLQVLLSGVIGAAGLGCIGLYEIERWPLLAACFVHYLIYMAAFIPASLLLGWVSTAADVLIMAAVLLAAQFTVFLIMCAIYRSQVRELNKLQKEKESKEKE